MQSRNGVTVIKLAWLYLLQQHIFRNLVHTFHWKQPPKLLLEVKKRWKSRFLGYFSKAKTEECNQKTWSVCKTFDITIHISAKCYAEVSAYVPQKVATKSSFRGKNTKKNWFLKYFSKTKMEELVQKYWTVCNNLDIVILSEFANSLQIH